MKTGEVPPAGGGRGAGGEVTLLAASTPLLSLPAGGQVDRQADNCISCIIDAAHQLSRCDAHYGHAVFLKPRVTMYVAFRPVSHVVAHAIQLDSEVCFCAIEVQHVWTDWMLAAKYRLSSRTRA